MNQSRFCFVHMPKCGGSSVRQSLERLIGSDNLLLDYGGVPGPDEVSRYRTLIDYVDNPVSLEPGSCVYGHFRPVKYLGSLGPLTDDISVFTILREPIDRLVSHYCYLISLDDASNPMRVALSDNQDDFAWFAKQPRLRNLYARHLYQVPISRLSFVGLYDQLDHAWSCISSYLRPGQPVVPLPKVNVTANRTPLIIPRPPISELLRSELEELHAEDIALYQYACHRSGFVPPLLT